MNSKISDKDKKDWENFLSSKDRILDKDNKNKEKKIQKKFSFDLHGYSLDEANKKVEYLINDCYQKNINKLILVTGKGLHSQNEKNPYVSKNLGILKYSVPEYIQNNSALIKLINNIEEASIEDGGSGALYIYIKKNYKINFDKSVSLTRLSRFLVI